MGADDGRDRGQHITDLLGADANLACNSEIQQIRHRRRIDCGQRSNPAESA